MRLAACLLLLASFGAHAVVIRDDVPDAQYQIAASDFPALADMPGEGHGVLIAPRWIVTAAHAVARQATMDEVVVDGTPRAVQRIVVHPGYRSPPPALVQEALASGDWDAFFDVVGSSDDIALIELQAPVDDIAPVPIHASPAPGDVVRIIGKGATGTGAQGHALHGPNPTALRHGFNTLTESGGRWICYTFDAPPDALPLEATSGSGDSGGPILVEVGDAWHLAGVNAWKRGIVEGTDVYSGRYGETSYGVRLAHYAVWIEAVTADRATPPR